MKRVVITGLGVLSSIGEGYSEAWNNLISCKSGIKIITSFDTSNLSCKIACFISKEEGSSNYDELRAGFPAGTVSGAPKIRAMEVITELEKDVRGPYAGAVGYFDFAGNMDTCITIRTMIIKDGVAHVQAGGGIVYDSVPGFEFDETVHKASALMRAIDSAEETV